MWPVLALSACTAEPAPVTAQRADEVVYGADDRTDFHAIADDTWRARARSTATLVPRGRLTLNDDGSVDYEATVYGPHFDLCPDQPFYDQPRLGRCSATLIDDDVVLTAGHCVPGQQRCDDRRFVFGWAVTEPGEAPVLRADDVYRCAEILATVDSDDDERRLDFAFIRLDRPVVGWPVAPLASSDEAFALGTPMTVIGYPNGIPLKYAPNGAVINPRAEQRDYFEATLDTFGGNSGSGVFDARGDVVGVLVRGERDYVTREGAECDEVNVLDLDRSVDEGAEDVTYLAPALEGLCRTGHRGPRLCTPGDQGWCYPCTADADCRAGWSCQASPDNPAAQTCAPPCADDAGCRADHTCLDGHCRPRLALSCNGADVWSRNGCGRWVDRVFACEADQRCAGQGCAPAPEGDRCGAPIELAAVDQHLEGDFVAADYGAFASGSCAGNGPEVVYAFELDVPTAFTAEARGFDTVLHLRAGCDGDEIACVDDSDPPGERGARIEAELPPGDYRLFLDAYDDDVEAFELDLSFTPTGCPVACPEGDLVCDGADVMRCAVVDGCPSWALVETCDRCEAGACVAPPPPVNTCETALAGPPVDTLAGALDGVTDADDGGCADALDWHHRFLLSAPTRLRIEPPEGVALTLRAACDAPPVATACGGSPLDVELDPGAWVLTVDAAAAWALDLSWTPISPCEPACAEGETRCADARTVETCAANASGCPRWVARGCPDSAVCAEGACQASADQGVVDQGVVDQGAPDAAADASPPDAGLADAATEADASSGSGGGGSGCQSSGDAPAFWLGGLLLLGWSRRRVGAV